ncbi:ATP-binding protein [uncultured Kriegella sp.]|uniref:ATP-binding protein n=1 Tax=uncultured Kriegella sp. TaxID=1798910 RepID=UPI0030D86768|tara:strand:- start:182872 stop:185022 length:2151 start_codon:yes stop_codon:yes gene_type:complete
MKSNALHLVLKKPMVAGFTSLIILLFIAQYIAYQKYLINENEQKKELNNQVDLIKEKLQALVMYSYSATETLGYLVERNGIPTDFDSIAIELLDRYKYFDVVELVDKNGFITHVYPLKDNEVIGFNILTSSEARNAALATIKRKDFFIAGPVNLKQGGVGMISRQPIFIDDEFSGFSAVITKLSTFFNDLNINTSNDSRFIYQLSRVNLETGKEDFFLENDMSSFKEFAVPIEMSFGEWKLYVVPVQRTANAAIWFSVFGLIVAIGCSWGVWLLVGQSERLNRRINRRLASQEIKLKSIHETTRSRIERSESNLNRAQQIASLGSWELDMVEDKLTWSEEMFRIFEKTPNTFEVTNETFLQAVHPDDRDFILKTYNDSIKNKKSYQITYRLKFGENHIKYVDEQCEIMYDKDQTPIRAFGTTQDITERINNEKELLNYKNNLEQLVNLRTEELNDSKEALLNLLEDLNLQSTELEKEKIKAQSADLMKSAFLATMSHELRTPMNSIIGFTGILLKEFAGPLNEEQRKQLSMVKNSSQHLLGLINDILDISKIEAGKLKVSIYPFNYVKTLEKTIDFLVPQAHKKGLDIRLEIDEADITLNSDERRIEQVLLNLISNAIKFSNTGTIKVKVAIIDNLVVTQVIDQGIGIGKTDLNKLFAPFIQLEGGISRSHEGTGLGLAICKSLVEKLGGTISVQSKKTKGSNFTFTLPFSNADKK